jgi:hypothetical protein
MLDIQILELLISLQGSLWRAIRAKKSPCEGWLSFLVGQKRSSSRLVILESLPMLPHAYFLHLSVYENVDIVHMFIEIYRIRKVFWKWFSWKVIHTVYKNFNFVH